VEVSREKKSMSLPSLTRVCGDFRGKEIPEPPLLCRQGEWTHCGGLRDNELLKPAGFFFCRILSEYFLGSLKDETSIQQADFQTLV
jgi:hypothetical protein